MGSSGECWRERVGGPEQWSRGDKVWCKESGLDLRRRVGEMSLGGWKLE